MKHKKLWAFPFITVVLSLTGCGASTISSTPAPGIITPDMFAVAAYVTVQPNAALGIVPGAFGSGFANVITANFYNDNNVAASPVSATISNGVTPVNLPIAPVASAAVVAPTPVGTVMTFVAVSPANNVMTGSASVPPVPATVSVNGVAGTITLASLLAPAAVTAAASNAVTWTAAATPVDNYFIYIYNRTTNTIVNVGGTIPYVAGNLITYTIPANTLIATNQYIVCVGSLQNGWLTNAKFPSLLSVTNVDLNVGASIIAN